MSDILKINTGSLEGPIIEKAKIFPLVKEQDRVLSEKMPEFDFTNPPVNPNEFASALVETCKHYKGLGLSANQCGFRYRVFVMGANDNFVAHFNPKIIEYSENVVHMSEGCLSFPFLFLYITRPETITVEYQDYTGATKQSTYSGLTARCFLHELDHMDGIVYTMRAKSLALKTGLGKRDKLLHRFSKANKKIMENKLLPNKA